MAGIRPGGLSDDEYSDEDQLMECDETVSKQCINRDKTAAAVQSQVWKGYCEIDNYSSGSWAIYP